MPEELLFGGKPKASEDSLFDKPKKSAKKTDSIFDAPATTAKPAKKQDDIFTETKPEVVEAKVEKPQKETLSKKPKNPKKTKKILAISLSCLGALLLIGGGIAGALWFIWYNSDEGILATTLNNALFSERDDIIVEGHFLAEEDSDDNNRAEISFTASILTDDTDAEIDLSEFEATIPQTTSRYVPGRATTTYTCGSRKYTSVLDAYNDCGFDYEYDYDYTAGHYEYDTTLKDFSFTAGAIIKDGDYFFKADLTDIFSMLGTDMDELEDYNDTWFRLSADYMNDLMGGTSDDDDLQACIEDITHDISGQKQILSLLMDGDDAIIKAKSKGRKDNIVDYEITVSDDTRDYADFLKEFFELDLVDKAFDCYANNIDGFSRSTFDDQFDSMIDALEDLDQDDREQFADLINQYTPEITLSVDASTRQISKIEVYGEFDDTRLEITLDFKVNTRNNPEIKAPTRYEDLEDLLPSSALVSRL